MATETAGVSIDALLRAHPEALGLPLELVSGASGLGRRITSPHVQKTGLALAGFDAYLSAGRILVLGESEIRYLESLESSARVGALRRVFAHDIPAVMITAGLAAPPELPHESERAGVPLLTTAILTPVAIAKVSAILEDSLAQRTIIHAVLMDILGLGVLIVGESGIGKSECALDLVVRGHRLVADDTVEVRRRAESVLIGTCPDLTRHHMEVRGLGLINIQDLFGVASTRSSKRVELVVQLERWEPGREYRAARPGRRALRNPGPPGPAAAHAGRPGPQPLDSRRGGGAQPDPEDAGPPRRPQARGSSRAPAPRSGLRRLHP